MRNALSTQFIAASIPLNRHISAENDRRKLKLGSIDAEFNVDVKNGLTSKAILSRS